ncbi:sesquipedalian-2 [Rhinatrema bivittatum]|uniref:sesquipedalian-2 n=1 Tax=Rhinatrema bivittatum TaxID=194408 RepID=UPI001126E5BE|nr:sesquipedalian-2 [Rhinatrema bivittatum]XP_029446283.1 sesquipedalian-2 [Rhinatrema bivittatum]XP_029446284.1 sesquipedalian-2 [Rhinatrema bivittatum]XP_029446286.1 sesquipedalian-2 [Rhinatrema bivittatum]XP_029446287.1 sesquipedalian-2 [Rhinatrema bivittatum]
MKLNERSVAYYATCDSPADNAGFLYKKGDRHTTYHKRWFVLKGNMLFYFEEKDSREPVGVIILEGCTVELCEAAEEYAFAIKFEGAKSRPYILAADSQAAMESWVKSLSRANFDYMRIVVRELEKQLEGMQESLAGSKRSQRRSGIYRRRPVSSPLAAPCAIFHPSQEKPIPHGSPVKENGYAFWNNPKAVETLPNGYIHSSPLSARTGSEDGGEASSRPPPLPPRRRPMSGNENSSGATVAGFTALTLESPFCPGTLCFEKLHDWYGKEIKELRKEWQESQGSKED